MLVEVRVYLRCGIYQMKKDVDTEDIERISPAANDLNLVRLRSGGAFFVNKEDSSKLREHETVSVPETSAS